ncbi:MAG: MmgE/PrpD family protein, partial [Polaromonas sp.]
MSSPATELSAFAAGLDFDAIPTPVVRRAEDLLVDWFGSALAGKGARPVETIARFALSMGPPPVPVPVDGLLPIGSAEVLIHRSHTSAYLAAMVNAAASHVAEQDDVHNGSVFHPATVVFPAALAVAQALGASGKQLLAASVAGYEVGIRVGEFL